MERWFYATGIAGETELTVPSLAGKEIKGRIYRDGIQFRPVEVEGNDPVGKEYRFESEIGKFVFAFPFDDNTDVDIPYEGERFPEDEA